MRHLILLALLVGCDGGETVWTETTKTDEGALCVEGLADDSATVYIDAQVCLSSSCDRNASGSCTATLDGTTITVSSTFSWEEASGINLACTDDCGFLGTSCTVGPLPAGTYTVVHGTSSEEITIPTDAECDAP